MTVIGPDFIGLQVRDLDRAATFYETALGLPRRQVSPPGGVVFDTEPIPFGVRGPQPGMADLDDTKPGSGVALWLYADDAQAVHDGLVEAGVAILTPPADGPFGRFFTFKDPDGYAVTIHDKQ